MFFGEKLVLIEEFDLEKKQEKLRKQLLDDFSQAGQPIIYALGEEASFDSLLQETYFEIFVLFRKNENLYYHIYSDRQPNSKFGLEAPIIFGFYAGCHKNRLFYCASDFKDKSDYRYLRVYRDSYGKAQDVGYVEMIESCNDAYYVELNKNCTDDMIMEMVQYLREVFLLPSLGDYNSPNN